MTNPIIPNPNTEEIVKGIDLTKNEWNIIKMVRQVRYGDVLVVKNGGVIVRTEVKFSLHVTENMNTNLENGIE